MDAEKLSGNKVIIAVAIFFIVGFVINLFLNYNQTNYQQERSPVGDEILQTVKGNSNKLDEVIKKLDENGKKVDDISNRVKILEANSKR